MNAPFDSAGRARPDVGEGGERPAWRTRPVHEVDFNVAPYTVIWEMTRACELNCLHCRAEAIPTRDPRELTTEEGMRVVDNICEFGSPVLVLTGGDPFNRPDLEAIVGYAAHVKHLRTSLAFAATSAVTHQRLSALRDAGVARVALSLDGSCADVHDRFRGVPGCFEMTLSIIRNMQALKIPLQINTTVSVFNRDDLPAIARLVEGFGTVLWSVFMLVPTGRASRADMISPSGHEDVFLWLNDLSKKVPFDIKVTAGQHYRRVMIDQARRRGADIRTDESGRYREVMGAGFSSGDGIDRPTRGVNDGNGLVFISHIGEICPSGFLPLCAGNVRADDLAEVYRHSELFTQLRDDSKLKGKCGACEYRAVCGGNRARAWAMTGDYLESDPACLYVPKSLRGSAGRDLLMRANTPYS